MEKTKLNWSKCPSVTPGGKPYFYVAFTNGTKLAVVWDRLHEQWSLTINDTASKLFNTRAAAVKCAEELS